MFGRLHPTSGHPRPRGATRPLRADTALLYLTLAAAVAALPVRGAVGAPPVAAPADHSCHPAASRQVEPRVVSAGGTVHVRVAFNYRCEEESRPVYFFLVVENTRRTSAGQTLLRNLREGLAGFVTEMDFGRGSQGGMILYNTNVTVDTQLQSGEGGQRTLVNAVNGFGTTSSQSARAAGEAVVKATELLAAVEPVTDALKVILLLDAGDVMTNAKVDALDACQAAKGAGIHMAVFALESAGDRLKDCAEPSSFRGSGRERGDDIPERLQQLGRGLAHGHQIERLGLDDSLSSAFEYVEGSASPAEPERFGNQLFWEILPPAPPQGHVYTYSVRVRPGIASEIAPVSDTSELSLHYLDTSVTTLPLANPEVCIHPPGNAQFCAPFVATLTPPAPTGTATATEPPSPTPPPASETPSPTPTAPPTDLPTNQPLFLPALVRGSTLP